MVAGHKGQVVGCERVSAADQLEARQLEALGAVDRLFSEKVSRKNTEDRAESVSSFRCPIPRSLTSSFSTPPRTPSSPGRP